MSKSMGRGRPELNTIDKPTLKQKFAALRDLPQFFKLVWQTDHYYTILSIILRLLRSAIPVSILYVGKLIIDEIIHLSNANNPAHDHLWKLIAAEFALAIVSDALARATALSDSLLGDLFSNYTSIRIMEHAATLDLDQFEDSEFYDKLERARQQTIGRTVLLSQVLTQVQDMISMIFLAIGLMAFNPWLLLLLLVAIVPAFLGESYFNDRTYALTRGQTPERRELDYMRYLGASDETAKEIKLFNLSGFLVKRFKTLSDKFYDDNRTLSVKRASWGTVFALLGSIGYYAAYIVMIVKTVEGALTIGTLTFLAGSFRQLRSLLENILSRFTSVAQGAIYLRDFFDLLL
jgi:ATP-binding cassette subfamily B protein